MADTSFSTDYQNSWALVVGIDTYKDPRLPPLGTAVKGARAFAALLREQFSFSPDQPGNWHQPYAGWEPTRYEDKARAEGRHTSFYLSFQRR